MTGDVRSARDTIIAAAAKAHGRIGVTDNEKVFLGIEVVNPLRGATQ